MPRYKAVYRCKLTGKVCPVGPRHVPYMQNFDFIWDDTVSLCTTGKYEDSNRYIYAYGKRLLMLDDTCINAVLREDL